MQAFGYIPFQNLCFLAKGQSPNHWTTRRLPLFLKFKSLDDVNISIKTWFMITSMETTQMCINRRMDRQWWYIHAEAAHSNKINRSPIHHDMSEFHGHYSKGRKSEEVTHHMIPLYELLRQGLGCR